MYLKSPIPWVGGKGKLLPAIHALASDGYSRFLDVFGGSGTVVLNHPHKKGVEEIYNDFNSDLTNLFECIKERTFALLKELGFLPIHSRDEYEVILKFLRGEDFTAKYMEQELELIDIFFEPLQAEELRQLKQERAEMYDVRRAAMYFRSIRESFCGAGKNFAGKSCNIRSFFTSYKLPIGGSRTWSSRTKTSATSTVSMAVQVPGLTLPPCGCIPNSV